MEDIKFTADDMINYAMWLAQCYVPPGTPLMEENREWYEETLEDFKKNERRNKKRRFRKFKKNVLIL